MQIDHMSVNIGAGFSVKEFKAVCPVTRMTWMQVILRASSRSANRFLQYIRSQAPLRLLPFRWTAVASIKRILRRPAGKTALICLCCLLENLSLTQRWNVPMGCRR